MKLTKYEHACITLEKDGKLLVVDPGDRTTNLGSPENVVGIVVTHEHGDHFDVNALGALIAHNPGAVVYSLDTIVRQFGDTLPHQAVKNGDKIQVGPFTLEFWSGDHASIHPTMPAIENLGVMVDDTLYYPGDSFNQPTKSVEVLALPVNSPWLKMSEAMDFLVAIKPRLAFPTHDAFLSKPGEEVTDRILSSFADKNGISYQRIEGSINI